MQVEYTVLPFLVLLLTACGGSSSNSTNDLCNELKTSEFSCDDMLSDVVSKSVLPQVEIFNTKLANLNSSMEVYCSEIENEGKLLLAQEAWMGAMEPLQQLHAMNFGPSSSKTNGLVSFYDWQTANAFNIDIAIAKYITFEDIKLSSSDNEKDLVALEYILFAPSKIQEYATPEDENQIVKNWRAEKNNDQIQSDRCAYGKLVIENLANRSLELEKAWQAFDISSAFSSKQVAANEVSDALFFADKQIKDAKVKAALPQASSENFDASKLESQFANVSKTHLINNLVGLKRIFTANDNGHGLDDYLTSANQADVAIKMIDQIDAAIANLEQIEGNLSDAVNAGVSFEACSSLANNDSASFMSLSDIDELCKFQYTIKQFTDTLKGDFIIATKFTTPASASGDND